MLDQIAAALAVKKSVLLAAGAGAVVSLRFAPEITTWAGRVMVVIHSFLLGIFASPYLADMFAASATGEVFLGVALSVFGISLCDAITRLIRQANLAELIAGYFKKPGA